MNTQKIEALWQRFHPGQDTYGMSVWWGMRKAEDCAVHGCHKWALRFFLWAVSKYDPSTKELFGDSGHKFAGQSNKRTEVRMLRAAHFLWAEKCPEPLYYLLGHKVTWETAQDAFPLPMMLIKMLYFPCLTEDEYKLANDALERGVEPSDALWPRRRTKSKYIALMAAAQTIAQHETAKS